MVGRRKDFYQLFFRLGRKRTDHPGSFRNRLSLFCATSTLDSLEEALVVGADRDKGRDGLEPLDDSAELLQVGEADDDLERPTPTKVRRGIWGIVFFRSSP